MIAAKCPLRISLAGGSTDLQEFVDEYGGGEVINFAANIYTYATINQDLFGLSATQNKYITNYSLREESSNINDIKNDVVRECFNYFNIPPVTSSLTADIFSSGSGLASSSSYLISFIKATAYKKGVSLTNEKICELALQLERKFNPLTGYQDPYGCGIGGLKKLTITAPSNVSVKQLDAVALKNIDMYLCHTGISRSSTSLLKKVNISKAKKLLPLVKQTERALQKEDPAELLELISEGWIKKTESCPDVISHPDVKSLNLLLEEEAAILSHRLCGAGNGGFFLIFTKPNWKPLINKLENKCVKINISNRGAQVKKL